MTRRRTGDELRGIDPLAHAADLGRHLSGLDRGWRATLYGGLVTLLVYTGTTVPW